MTYLMLGASLGFSIWAAISGNDPSAYAAASFVICALIGSKP